MPDNKKWLYKMLCKGAFIWQYDGEEEGWTYDDTVWGLFMQQAIELSDDAEPNYDVYIVPASVDKFGSYYIDWEAIDSENLQSADMCFTNTYSAHVYKLNHDADGHWDECAGCKDKQNENPHEFDDWTVNKEATEKEVGEKEHTCTVCGYTEKAEIPVRTNVQTGDNSSFALWAALFTLSAAAVTVTVSAAQA